MAQEFHHIPVLYNEVISLLSPSPGESYLDVTLGGAGHASGVADAITASGTVRADMFAFDRDPFALDAAVRRLSAVRNLNLRTANTSFVSLDSTLRANSVCDREDGGGFDLALADFGLSSPQIDDASRGFSFQADGPLDMRMGDKGESASEMLARIDADGLADVLYEYGDIRQSRHLARVIKSMAAEGRMSRTSHLAEAASRVLGGPRPGRHNPAARVFQAVRIAVNDEFGAIDSFLADIPKWMASGGRLAVISFHSGEDRRVKEAMRKWQNPCTCPPRMPCVCGRRPLGELVTRKAVEATEGEARDNPRARSAKLRVFKFF